MFPLRDTIPSRRPPVMMWAIILANCFVFVIELGLPPPLRERLFYWFGVVPASVQTARALKHHPGRVTVFVPHMAMSGGTLIALATDQIVMSPHAVLGPVDPQLGQTPAVSVLKAVQRKPIERVDDQTLILADQAEKAVRQLRETVKDLLSGKMAPEKAEELAGVLAGGTWTHDHPITAEAAAGLGLPVSTEMPETVLDLMALYPQPVRQVPTVEYLPVPRRSEGRK